MSRLSGLVGRGGMFPHKMVHGKLADQWAVVYKPATLSLVGDELGSDSLLERLGGGWEFPEALEKEEEGLQIVTRTSGMARFFEKTRKLGLWGLGYSAILDIPNCVKAPGAQPCQHLPFQNGISHLILQGPADPVPRKDKSHIDTLFSSGTSLLPSNQVSCIGCTCKSQEPPSRTATLEATLWGPNGEYNITSPSSATEVRKLLSYSGLPVINDHLYNTQALLGEEEYYSAVMGDVQFLGLGLSLSALKIPDPAVKANWDLCYGSDEDKKGLEWSYIMVSAPRPPSFTTYLEGGLVDRSIDYLSRVVVTGAHRVHSVQKREAKTRLHEKQQRSCLHCLSESHTVDVCPELNSDSTQTKFNKSMQQLAGIEQYCVICSSTEHEQAACSRRRRGVDPETNCPICGSVYHDVLQCEKAHAIGLGSKEKADAYALSCGHPSYEVLMDFKQAAERQFKKGSRPTLRQVKGKRDHLHTGKVDPVTLTPDSPQVRTTSRDRIEPYNLQAQRRKEFNRNNQDLNNQERDKRVQDAIASRSRKIPGGVDFSSFEKV